MTSLGPAEEDMRTVWCWGVGGEGEWEWVRATERRVRRPRDIWMDGWRTCCGRAVLEKKKKIVYNI